MKFVSMQLAALVFAGSAVAAVSDVPQAKPEEKSDPAAVTAPHRHGNQGGCPMHGAGAQGMRKGKGKGPQGQMGAMRGHGKRGRDEAHAADRDTIHALLADHKKITRKVEDIPKGVRTLTTSADPAVAAKLQEHVFRMQDRMESGSPIRMHDPLFVELFKHHDKVDMTVEKIDGGVRVVQTSEDPQVVLLVRQHARRGIDEFVARGFERAPEPTPLPEGYKAE